MDLVNTDLVKPEDERPARRDGTCFYCSEKIGDKHKAGCVIVSKSIVVSVNVDVVISVPRDWDAEMIEFSRNESSWCSDNLLEDLGRWAASDSASRVCSCGAMEVEFKRDATENDHNDLPDLTALP